MKSDTIELRPIHVRKKPRTRTHVFIAMLSYIIEKHLREKWKDINIIVDVNAGWIFSKIGEVKISKIGG